MSYTTTVTALIQNGQSLSAGIRFSGGDDAAKAPIPSDFRLCGIVMPSAWTTANLTFQSSVDGGTTWNDLYDATGAEIAVTTAASRAITLDPAIFAAVTHIRVRSGTTGTPVNQGAARTITLVLRSV